MLQRRALMASGAALTLTSAIPAAWAATPKDTVVFASQIDDLITFDPGEAYEISAQIIASDIYDRLVRYEAEDMTKLVGGVAQSWTVSPDSKTFTFKLRPNQKFESGATVTADDMVFSLQRVVILDKTPAFLFTQLGWNKDNVKTLITAPDASTLKFTITENFAPSLVLNLMATVAASVVEKKVAMANEVNGDLGNTWLKTHSATSGPYRLVTYPVPGADGSCARGRRRLNLVWYDPAHTELLTGVGLLEGESVYGSLAAEDVPAPLREELRALSQRRWPAPWGRPSTRRCAARWCSRRRSSTTGPTGSCAGAW